MFPPQFKDLPVEGTYADVGSALQKIAVALLAFTAFACAHAILFHLHYILAPFVLSAFLVFALEPIVNKIYVYLAGLAPPYRWCCCCMYRRQRSRRLRHGDTGTPPSECLTYGEDSHQTRRRARSSESSGEESSSAEEYGEDGATEDWNHYSLRILDGCCRFVAVVVVMAAGVLVVIFLVYLLASGALRIKDNWDAYQKGMEGWIAWLDTMRGMVVARLKLSGAADSRVRVLYTNVLSKIQEMILELVNSIVGFVTGGVSFAVIVMLYMLFWLFQPLPIGGKASALVQNYIWKKTFVSFLYGISVTTLLYCMGIDLPAFFGLASFFLNYVPEVGAFISMLAPVPIILLNGNIQSPVGYLILAIIGQVVLKLFIGNFLEMKLISGDDEMSLHPVWVLLGLNYFGFLWGPVGMLISVPLLATLKSIVISKEQELRETQPFLAEMAGDISACLEGRRRRSGAPSAASRRSSWLLPSLGGFGAKKERQERSPEQLQSEPAAYNVSQLRRAAEEGDAAPKEETAESEEIAGASKSVPKKSRQ